MNELRVTEVQVKEYVCVCVRVCVCDRDVCDGVMCVMVLYVCV